VEFLAIGRAPSLAGPHKFLTCDRCRSGAWGWMQHRALNRSKERAARRGGNNRRHPFCVIHLRSSRARDDERHVGDEDPFGRSLCFQSV
jgi:hypothetical protein